MGNPIFSDRPSLDRLKALTSLPDLSSQVEEAKQLCNHSARADMVCKWLLEKLKCDEHARTNQEAWGLLQSSLRLLSPERVSALLGSHSFLESCKSALSVAEHAVHLLPTLSSAFGFLLDVSNGPNGTQIKATLSSSSSAAASFVGVWLQAVYHATIPTAIDNSSESLHPLLRPAMEIWSLRKRSPEENNQFAHHCLAPASRLLAVLSKAGVQRRSKRKHRDRQAPQQDSKHSLESMVARHVFLSARTAFFKAQDVAEDKRSRKIGSQNPAFTINAMLEPFKRDPAANAEAQHLSSLGALPLLLDIAARCTPMSTPKQRTNERPWMEAVFEALHNCNKTAAGGLIDNKSLIEMLAIMKKYTSLPRERLDTLVRQHAGFGDTSKDKVDWKLVAQVIDLDSDCFADKAAAELLFDQVTAGMMDFATRIDMNDSSDEQTTLWSDHIIVPVMKAFARRQNLATFVDLWLKQLTQKQDVNSWSVWTSLDDPFGTILKDTATVNLIRELFSRLSTNITQAPGPEDADEQTEQEASVNASIVVIHALLNGVINEALLKALQEPIEELLTTMLHLVERSSASEGRRWALLTKLFELWFPGWAIQQKGTDAMADIARRGLSMVQSAAVTNALVVAKRIRENKDASLELSRIARDAECFVASVCYHFHKYGVGEEEDCSVACAVKINHLVQQLVPEDLVALISYPELLSVIEDTIRNDFFIAIIDAAVASPVKREVPDSVYLALMAMAEVASKLRQSKVIAGLVRISVEYLTDDGREVNALAAEEPIVLDMISKFPVKRLERLQRESLLNAIIDLPYSSEALSGAQLRKRLVLMIGLMQEPNATSMLSTDSKTIWRLALPTAGDRPADDSQSSATLSAMSEHSSLMLLEELTRLNLSHLLATQDQERSRATLINFSTDAKKYIDSIGDIRDDRESQIVLTIVRAIVDQTEADSKDGLKSYLPHCDPLIISGFCEKLRSTMAGVLFSIPGHNKLDAVQFESLYQSAITLFALQSLIPNSNETKDATDSSLAEAVDSLLARYWSDGQPTYAVEDQPTIQVLQAAIVSCFELYSRHSIASKDLKVATLAVKILEMQPPPPNYVALLAAFQCYVKALDPSSRMQVLFSFVHREKPSIPILSLAEACISELEITSDSDNIGFTPPYGVIPQLLDIAVEGKELVSQRKAVQCILTALKAKTFLTNQYVVEATMVAIPKMLRRTPTTPKVYLDACEVMSILLQQYRSRLQGRFHLVIEVFIELVSYLFRSARPNLNVASSNKQPTAKHAQALARLLNLFCEPPQLRRQQNTSELVDEARKEQAHVGQYIQFVLHHYCAQVLNGTLVDGMREALIPGLWSMIEAIQIHDGEGIAVLSAAMNNSERAVLRSLYDDWRRSGKWRGG